MYADDICLMAPSPAALQKLINICYDFSLQNNLTFNSSKSFCMVYVLSGIRATSREIDRLIDGSLWPRGVIVKEYTKFI